MDRAEAGQHHERRGQHPLRRAGAAPRHRAPREERGGEQGGQVRDEAGEVRGRLALEARDPGARARRGRTRAGRATAAPGRSASESPRRAGTTGTASRTGRAQQVQPGWSFAISNSRPPIAAEIQPPIQCALGVRSRCCTSGRPATRAREDGEEEPIAAARPSYRSRVRGSEGAFCAGLSVRRGELAGRERLSSWRRTVIARDAGRPTARPTAPMLRRRNAASRRADASARFESSPGFFRYFCARCGSVAPGRRPGRACASSRSAAVDDDPGVRPEAHIFVASKAPWYEVQRRPAPLRRLPARRGRAGAARPRLARSRRGRSAAAASAAASAS